MDLVEAFVNILNDFGILNKMLSITADKLQNETLVADLADLDIHFAGDTNHTCCFLHTINLVAKSLLWEFNTPKKGNDEDELDELTKNINLKELQTWEDPNKGPENDNNDDGWIDKVALLNCWRMFGVSICPVRLVLVKVKQRLPTHMHILIECLTAILTHLQTCVFYHNTAANIEIDAWRTWIADSDM